MDITAPTLCLPDHEKSCFACCPPIRPAGYEHIQYQNSIKRILRENNEGFDGGEKGVVPITGFSCWALGYIDTRHKLVGCLLHSGQNRGVDLRYRVDYGEKCRRETCPDAKAFDELGLNEQKFWLHLTDGLDSFSYSSRKMNPLFKMMGWGTHLLRLIAIAENKKVFTRESFFQYYPFFSTPLLPRANAYLLDRLVGEGNIHILKNKRFMSELERLAGRILRRLRQELPETSDGPYVHRLNFDLNFLDFLRLSVPILRLDENHATLSKEITDEELEEFRSVQLELGALV